MRCVGGTFNSVREALAKARFLQFMEEHENRDNGEVLHGQRGGQACERPKVDLNRVVEACMRQLQALQASKKQNERPGYVRKKRRCWCCGQKGNLVKACPLVQRNKAACKQKAEKVVPNGAQRVPDGTRECQRVPEGARGYQRVPDGVRDDAKECQRVPDGTSRVPEGVRGCQMVPMRCQVVPEGARGCQVVQECTRGCQRVPDG